jgi:hypothetical protein
MDALVVGVAVVAWLLLLVPAAFAFMVRDVGCSPADRVPLALTRPLTSTEWEPELSPV